MRQPVPNLSTLFHVKSLNSRKSTSRILSFEVFNFKFLHGQSLLHWFSSLPATATALVAIGVRPTILPPQIGEC